LPFKIISPIITDVTFCLFCNNLSKILIILDSYHSVPILIRAKLSRIWWKPDTTRFRL